jgi:hypothetical protein
MKNILENWKAIPGYENLYEASDQGRIRSFNSNRGDGYVFTNRANSRGYFTVSLVKEKVSKQYLVHQLVAMTFLNHVPNGNTLVVDHINDNKLDNRLMNLQVIHNFQNIGKSKKYTTSQGFYYNKAIKKYYAQVKFNGVRKSLGLHKTAGEAREAYKKFCIENNLLDRIKYM